MDAEVAFKFFKKLEQDHFSLIYLGEFDDALTPSFIRINENSLHESQAFKNKLSSFVVECFQNIVRHADRPDIITRTNNKPKMFMIRNIGYSFYIASTNLINNNKKEDLLLKLKSIDKFSAEELKTAYLDSLPEGEISDTGSGGLGLIEMAKKSNCELKFDFEFINYFFSIFFLQLKLIALNDLGGLRDAVKLNNSKELYNELLAENILMIRKGDFSQKTILPMLDILENNIQSQRNLLSSGKKIFYMLVELLQNISKHAKENNGSKEGIFIIAVKNDQHILTTGNYIENDKVDQLKKKLESLASMNKEALADIYKENLLSKDTGVKGGAGVGLIEMSKYSLEKIKYNFKFINVSTTFFSLSITI